MKRKLMPVVILVTFALIHILLAAPVMANTIAAGSSHSLALQSDGTVVAWGYNYYGQASVPSGLNEVVAVAAGGDHSLALKSDGNVVAWGSNSDGQTSVPSDLSGVIAVAAGYYHNIALKSDGTVVAWGDNSDGQISVPSDLIGVVAVAAGGGHNLALKSDGTVVAWGLNKYGQTNVPSDLSGVVAVAAGLHHSLALKSDGTVVAWGLNSDGQPSVPSDLSGGIAVAAGFSHSLALKSDGHVVAWGSNSGGETSVPSDLSEVVAVAAGGDHNLALKSDGTVVAWGYNSDGQTSVPSALGTVAMAPVAKIDPVSTATHGVPAELSCKGSDPDNNVPLSYAWAIISKPEGSQASLSDANTATPSLTPDVLGDYRVMLLVRDAMGIYSDPVWATISTVNSPPVANAGPDQLLTATGSEVSLNALTPGSSSYDPDGDTLIFQWRFVSWPGSNSDPPTSPPSLSGADTASPAFVAGSYGEYSLQLVVSDGMNSSQPDMVLVGFENLRPVANAGGNQSKVVGEIVNLDGTKSSDPNGDTLTYLWTVTDPDGNPSTYDSAEASLVANTVGDYQASLTVSDGLLSNTSSATITVISRQSAATGPLKVVIDSTIKDLPPGIMVNRNQANALTNKINAVLKLIDQEQYRLALQKLQSDILPKTNGCAAQGAPDNNDWILDCATQKEVYDYVNHTLDYLEGLP